MDEAHGFVAEDAGEFDVRRVSETCEEFGAVEAEGFDLDEDLAFARCGDWAGFEFEGSRGSGVMEDDGLHVGHLGHSERNVSRLGYSFFTEERRMKTATNRL